MANTVEAVIGALFLDGGIKKSEEFIFESLLSNLDEYVSAPLKDAKSKLQEEVQAQGYMAPKYDVVSEEGPDHDKKFTVEVVIDGKAWAKGEGKSKSLAEQSAAQKALERM